jgi:spore coat polysaccharide biosynthesis protein SpsF
VERFKGLNSGAVVGVVQARMNSVRFPQKMISKLGGIQLLEWVIIRASKSRNLNKLVLAIGKGVSDDPLEELAKKYNILIFRGNENDVLSRIAGAAKKYDADIVVRICADNPFIDPNQIDILINSFKSGSYDYMCNHQNRLNSGFADGFGAEILSASILHQLTTYDLDQSFREHATSYIWAHFKRYKISVLQAPANLAYPHLKFDVDFLEDLNKLNSLVDAGVTIESRAEEIIKIALNLLDCKE